MLALAPFEFGAEDVEESVGAGAEEADAGLGTVAVDVVAEVEFDGFLAVGGEVDLVGDADDVDADGGLSGDDDGTDGEQVRTDGVDDDGIDRGHDNGPVGGEVVGSRASGRGDDDAVGAEGGDELLVDFDGEVAHAGDGAFADDDIVEGVPLLEGATFADEGGVHHAADFDIGGVAAPGIERGVEIGERDFRRSEERR